MEPEALLPLNPRDYLILFSLVSSRRHGYGIVKEVERQSKGRVQLDPANLYRSIKRLARDGLVTEVEVDSACDDQDDRRRYYAMTEFGRRVVALEAARLAELSDAARGRNLIPQDGSER